MAVAPDALILKLQSDPTATVKLIVRLKDDLTTRSAQVQAKGLVVRRKFALIGAVAVEGPASAALDLAREPWVLSIEEDVQVHTM